MSYDLRELEMTRAGEKFFSRKNSVFKSVLSGKAVVVKVFAEGATDIAQKEYSLLEKCQERSIPAPIPLELGEDVIVMEYVEGPTLSEFLDSAWSKGGEERSAGRSNLDSTAASLGKWFADFHSAFDHQLCRGDANMRNFLIGLRGVTGIDFEESGGCEVIDDIGQACSSILSMHPMFTREKAEFCRNVAETYFSAAGVKKVADLNEATARALEHYASFRPDGELMVRKAVEIRSTGIWSGEE